MSDMTAIYDNVDDVPEDHRRDLLESTVALAMWLRAQRKDAGLHSLSAELLTADGPARFTCGPDDRVSLRIGDETIDVTDLRS
jgi:hypothetical protein